ncbi:MAG: hypothetical protein ACYC6X_03275 [Minisyncoccota bacterium]
MSNTVTGLTALTTPHSTDLLPIVDMSGATTTKKIQYQNLVNCSSATNCFSVGIGGQYADLASAFTARSAVTNTLLATYTGSITGTSGGTLEKHYLVADSGTPLSGLLQQKGDIGVRIGGVGNPVVRGSVINSTTIYLQAPIPKDFPAGTAVDVYDIVPATIMLTPGTHIRYNAAVSGSMTIPAFTTITALVPHTATIEMIGTSAIMFAPSNTQNEIYFTDLNLVITTKAINLIFWQLPSIDGINNLQWMTEFGLINDRINSIAEDFVYNVSAGAGAFIARDNDVRGTYDVFRFSEHRKILFTNNDINCYSQGQGTDMGEPTPIVIGGTGGLAYPRQEYFILNNRLTSVADAVAGDTQGHAAAFEIRNPLSTNARVIIRGNTLRAVVTGGSDAAGAIGVKVAASLASDTTNNPYIEVTDNDLYVTNAGSGPAALYDNNGAGGGADYFINIKNNNILPGSTTAVGQGIDQASKIKGTYATLAPAGTWTPSVATADALIINSISGALTIANPPDIIPGKIVTFILKENATAGHAVTWGNVYKFSSSFVQSVATTDALKTTTVSFVGNNNGELIQISPANSWII